MKKIAIILLTVLLFSTVLAQNETPTLYENQTNNNNTITNQTWYAEYTNEILAGDNLTLLFIIGGLILVYIFGKIAFKLIKWAIIILAIILVLKIIF